MSISLDRRGAIALLCLLGAAIAGCDSPETDQATKPLARPVSYLELKLSDPSLRSLVAGSVESWKKELVGFRVSGRVRFVREAGNNIQARSVDGGGELAGSGGLLGSLENERYQLRVKEAQARVDSIAAEGRALRTDIEQTIPSELEEIQAEYDRAKTEYWRQRRLLNKGVGTQKRVDDARTQFKTAEARLAQVRSKRNEKKAQLASIEAQVVAAEEALRRAQIDLADTELYAPFNGQISKVHVIPGGFVEKGQPVVTVQMMDPVKVQVAVSPDIDRQVHFNDLMKIYVDGLKEPINGWVWNKDTVADAATRTFMITLLVRNRQVEVDRPPELDGKEFHRTPSLWNVEFEHDDGRAPFFTNDETLGRDEEGYFVWKADGLSIADLDRTFNPVFRVKKVRVKLGSRRLRLLQLLDYRELEDLGGLDPKTDLLAGKLPADVEDGDTIMLSRKRWLLRPGQLVRVDLHHGRMPAGFYVPAQAVIKDAAGHHVFVVEERPNGEERAARVAVRLGATVGTFQAVEPVAEGGLARDMKLIVDGAHYLRDGEAVNAFYEVENAL